MAAKKKTENKPVEMTCKVSDWDQYLFGQGNHYEIYKKLGAHLTEKDGVAGTYFAVWAPRAKSVKLIGDFNCIIGLFFLLVNIKIHIFLFLFF